MSSCACPWWTNYLFVPGGKHILDKGEGDKHISNMGGTNIFTYMGGHTFLHTRGEGKHFYTGCSNNNDVDGEKKENVSEVNNFKGHEGP